MPIDFFDSPYAGAYPDDLTNAVETMDRDAAQSYSAAPSNSGRVHYTFFTAQRTTTITQILTVSGDTQAGATPTLCRVGFYAVSDDLTTMSLACAIASDTSLWASTFTEYVKSLSTGGGLPSSYTFVKGKRYAAGLIVVTAATMPKFQGTSGGSGALNARAPRLAGTASGNTDLPAGPVTISGLSNTAATSRIYVAGLP